MLDQFCFEIQVKLRKVNSDSKLEQLSSLCNFPLSHIVLVCTVWVLTSSWPMLEASEWQIGILRVEIGSAFAGPENVQ